MCKLPALFTVAILAMTFTACCDRSRPQTIEQDSKMIRLNVFVTVTPEHHAEVVEGFNRLAQESQKEDGCIGYDIFQNTLDPGKLIIVETWRDQQALDAHGQTPHYTTILPLLGEKIQMSLDRFEF